MSLRSLPSGQSRYNRSGRLLRRRVHSRPTAGGPAAGLPGDRQYLRRDVDESAGRHRWVSESKRAQSGALEDASMKGTNKVALLGGGGLRTPLLIHGLAEARAAIGVRELALYDIEPRRATMMAKLGEEIAVDTGIRITAPSRLEEAIEGAAFVL